MKQMTLFFILSFPFQMKMPNLSDHLDLILPPCLNFVDDHELTNKIVGVQCLHHILNNTSSSEIRW